MKEEFDPAVSKKYCHQLYHKQTKPAHRWGFSVPSQKEKNSGVWVWKPWPMEIPNRSSSGRRTTILNFCQKDIQHNNKSCLKIKCKKCQESGQSLSVAQSTSAGKLELNPSQRENIPAANTAPGVSVWWCPDIHQGSWGSPEEQTVDTGSQLHGKTPAWFIFYLLTFPNH